ncbi:MAG: septum formation protein Maf [Chloroflexi bacterium]|nr:septum formation protein Maf [Chloroflexota bacterium]
MTEETTNHAIVLASGSPRRRELLSGLGLVFRVAVSDAEEHPQPGEPPADLVRRLSLAKAAAVAAAWPTALVIAADTVVVLEGDLLGKPRSDAEAAAMLERLRNRQHEVYTGLTLLCGEAHNDRSALCVQAVLTPVTMRNYQPDEVAAYVASGDPRDKAGAYAIQSAVFNPIAHIDGCYANVMGLPLCHLYRCLAAWGVAVPVHPLRCCPHALRAGCVWAAAILSEACPSERAAQAVNLT